MTLTYFDQNALIYLHQKVSENGTRENLYRAIGCGSVIPVVSTWHLIETAHTTRVEEAIALADFMDSLKPSWLLERRDIQRLEVEEDFFRFAKIDFQVAPRVTDRAGAIATLNKEKVSERHDIPSRNFVEQWIKHPEQVEPLELPYRKNAQNLPRLRELAKAGKLTPEVKQQVDRKLFESTLPRHTRAGLEMGPELRRAYLDQASLDSIPSFSIENAIFEHELEGQGRADRNTLTDKFHLISALSYVDEIVSDDRFFARLHPIAEKTGHVKAKLIKFEQFCERL